MQRGSRGQQLQQGWALAAGREQRDIATKIEPEDVQNSSFGGKFSPPIRSYWADGKIEERAASAVPSLSREEINNVTEMFLLWAETKENGNT